jgi:hypothetical protein
MKPGGEPGPERKTPVSWSDVFTSERLTWRSAVIAVIALTGFASFFCWMMSRFAQ